MTKRAKKWLVIGCPNLVRIGSNANFLGQIALPVGTDRQIVRRARNELNVPEF